MEEKQKTSILDIEEMKRLQKYEKYKEYIKKRRKHFRLKSRLWHRQHKEEMSKKAKEIYRLNKELHRCVVCGKDNDCTTVACSKCRMKYNFRKKKMKGGKSTNEN